MSLLSEEISFSPKLEVYRANQDQIRNQRPRLHRNTLILGRKAGGGFSRCTEFCLLVYIDDSGGA